MNSRNQKGSRQSSNFSRRQHDESPNQWTAYGRSDSDRNDRGSYRADQTNWTGSDYDRSGSPKGNERQQQMNRYPHSYSEYDSHRDMESRRFGASEGDSYLTDRSHESYSNAGEMYRPGMDESSRSDSRSRMEPSYSGRGPRGFKRSDERIKEEVCEMLTRDHAVDAEDIEVEVTEGEVTLTGSVPERRMKHRAEDCVERALGVKDVINNIRVKREGGSLTGDRTTTDTKSPGRSGSSTGKSNH